MKKSILFCFFFLFCFSVFGIDVPGKVLQAFKDKYPEARSVKWELEEGAYEAEFKWKGGKYSAEFDANGNLLLQSTYVKVKDIPLAIRHTLDSLYKGANIKEVELQESSSQGQNYVIEIHYNKEDLELYFTPAGELLNVKKD